MLTKVVIAPQNWTFHNENENVRDLTIVVIAPQNWTFHNGGAASLSSFRCNSPSKLDLPQQTGGDYSYAKVVIAPQNWTFHNKSSINVLTDGL